MSRFRVEQNSQSIRSSYNPETCRWSAQVLGSRVNPITLLAESYCLCVAVGETSIEAEDRAALIVKALNAQAERERARGVA